MIQYSGISIEATEIVATLKQELRLKEICQAILYRQIIHRYAQEQNLVVSEAEIQQEADRQRYERHLESATATYAWLQEQLITMEEWEAGIRDRLLTQRLAETRFAPEAEQYFAEHRLQFEQVVLYQITVPYQQLSQELFYQIEESEISFYEAAHLYDMSAERRLKCGYEGKIYRRYLNPNLAPLIFAATPGAVLGPLESPQGFDLLWVDDFINAEFTPETCQMIIQQLFQEWLDRELTHWIHHS
ncbi:MAG: peptidylprolyl isomerase [Oculatellaceae cyanobacterium Prado106]|jgi:parvulin-like peptidyl-prolyl isomerase|nr:peptidylprolyl isomerase [Oculatellaceae cyanobacterium Prado106]